MLLANSAAVQLSCWEQFVDWLKYFFCLAPDREQQLLYQCRSLLQSLPPEQRFARLAWYLGAPYRERFLLVASHPVQLNGVHVELYVNNLNFWSGDISNSKFYAIDTNFMGFQTDQYLPRTFSLESFGSGGKGDAPEWMNNDSGEWFPLAKGNDDVDSSPSLSLSSGENEVIEAANLDCSVLSIICKGGFA